MLGTGPDAENTGAENPGLAGGGHRGALWVLGLRQRRAVPDHRFPADESGAMRQAPGGAVSVGGA